MNSQANVVKGGNVVTGGTLILCFCFSTFLTMLAKQTIPVVSQQSTFYTFS
jgi:sulfite exporter TauE/SafE